MSSSSESSPASSPESVWNSAYGFGSSMSSTMSGCSDNSPTVTATSVSISTPFSGALAAPASPLPLMGRFGGILIH